MFRRIRFVRMLKWRARSYDCAGGYNARKLRRPQVGDEGDPVEMANRGCGAVDAALLGVAAVARRRSNADADSVAALVCSAGYTGGDSCARIRTRLCGTDALRLSRSLRGRVWSEISGIRSVIVGGG